jgi:hypothetical protein
MVRKETSPVALIFDIHNALTKPGDPVQFELRGAARKDATITIYEQALSDRRRRRIGQLKLGWKRTSRHWLGTAAFTPKTAGHYHAILQVDGGEAAGRYFAAWDGRQAAATLFLNGLRPGLEDYGGVVRPHFLPMEYHVDDDFPQPNRAYLRWAADLEFRYGQRAVPRLVAGNLGFAGRRFSLWEFSLDETIGVLELLKRLWAESGFPSLNAVNIHWCMGNVTMRALRRCGIHMMTGLVPNYEMRDGESREIANGSPLRPYWVHRDDFRKAGCAGGRDYLLCATFSVVLPTEMHRGNPDAHWAPDIPLVWDRSVESGDEALRSKEVLDFLCDQPPSDAPFFIPIGIQNFGPPAVYESNRNTIRYALQQARAGKLVFADHTAIHDYFVRYCPRTPESVAYIRDFMIGSHLINKPIHHPDVIQIQNDRFHAAWEAGQALPEYLYDYTRRWRHPDREFRDYTKHGPQPENLHGVRVSVKSSHRGPAGCLSYSVRIESKRAIKRLPLALWDLPVVPERIQCSGLDVRAIEAPFTRQPHLILEGPVVRGTTNWRITVTGRPFTAASQFRSYPEVCSQARSASGVPSTTHATPLRSVARYEPGLVGLKTIPNPGRVPYTYLWTNLRVNVPVRLRVPPGRSVWLESYEAGTLPATTRGSLSAELKWPRPFVRIWNVAAHEIEIANGRALDALARDHLADILQLYPLPAWRARAGRLSVAEIPAFVTAYQNAYIDRFHRKLVRQAREWFRMLAPAEDLLIEAHAYAKGHLGGPWRDKADFENIITARPGLRFEIPVYDYAVCYEPGHRSWQMGRAFTLRFHGLNDYAKQNVVVHLHAYDYDCLGRSYSVRLSHPGILGGRQVEILRSTFPLPQGRKGRDDPRSLISLSLPPEFLAKPFFNVHVLEGYDQKNVDFRNQVPYSVAISDVWVTANPCRETGRDSRPVATRPR